VCQELRDFIIDVVSVKGGHFGASLGVVELTVALHYVFNTPYDQLVWDVGHQAYGHKILTGRRENFHTNRIHKGISGFPKRSESEYDTFGVGHSSTSIGGALGMAVASKLKGELDRHTVAVIGDGAMTAGMAFEASTTRRRQQRYAGGAERQLHEHRPERRCAQGIPHRHHHQPHLQQGEGRGVETAGEKSASSGPMRRPSPRKVENAVKSRPAEAEQPLSKACASAISARWTATMWTLGEGAARPEGHSRPEDPAHVTMKGKGYKPAEEGSPTVWHAPGLFNKETGEIIKVVPKSPQPPKYQDVFGHTIVELAEKNPKIVGVTPAMPSGCSLNIMMKAMPDRAFDVGIAEQHAVTFSAGMATQGLVPFCNIYSSFMQRAYDQVVHDVALQKLHVVFCLDRGGLAGADGPTHHGAFDIAYFRCIPNMIVSAPMNEEELRNLMYTAQLRDNGPFSIRYPRGEGVMTEWKTPFKEITIGTGRKCAPATTSPC
jgi:1-deoxy-D-xylulose-5-phosphate synthase